MTFSHTNSKGQTYYLHTKKVQRKSGRATVLYYFAREQRPDSILESIPKGYEVVEMKTGLPVLRLAGNPSTDAPPPKRRK